MCEDKVYLWQAREVAFGYAGKLILDNLNFSIKVGDYLVIIGDNGSGKSTVMQGLLSIVAPKGGTLEANKILKTAGIGYLPQQGVQLNDLPASVEEIVISGCLNKMGWRPFYSQKEKEKAKGSMEFLEITDLAKKKFGNLSGGQKQRVLLARALCASTTVLLMDEPLNGIDVSATELLYGLLKKLHREKGLTVVMISHDRKRALQDATHVLALAAGQQKFFGTKEGYLSFEENSS